MSSNLFSQPTFAAASSTTAKSPSSSYGSKRRNSTSKQHFEMEKENTQEMITGSRSSGSGSGGSSSSMMIGPSSSTTSSSSSALNKSLADISKQAEEQVSSSSTLKRRGSHGHEDKICVQMEDIIEAPGHIMTSDPLFDVFKCISQFLTDKESFECGIASCCKSAREAVLQTHFLGKPSIINNYLKNWIISKTYQDHSRKELPDLVLRFNNALFVHMNPILMVLCAQHGCEAILFETINHPFLTFSIFRHLSSHDIGELMQFTNMKFYSIFHPLDLFSILLCEAVNCNFYNLATTLYNHHLVSATCPLHAKEKVSKLEIMMEIALERDLPKSYFFLLEKLVEMKRLYIEELTDTYNRLSQSLDTNPIRELVEGEDASSVGWVPIIEEEEQEMEWNVEKKLVQRYFHSKFKHFILECPRIFYEGFMESNEKDDHILQVLKRFVGGSKCMTIQEREFMVEKFVLALVRNLDRDLPYVVDCLAEHEAEFSYDFIGAVFGNEGIVKNGILKSVHIFKTVGHLLDREKKESLKSGAGAGEGSDSVIDHRRVFSVEQLKEIFEEMEFRHNFIALENFRKKLVSYRDQDLI